MLTRCLAQSFDNLFLYFSLLTFFFSYRLIACTNSRLTVCLFLYFPLLKFATQITTASSQLPLTFSPLKLAFLLSIEFLVSLYPYPYPNCLQFNPGQYPLLNYLNIQLLCLQLRLVTRLSPFFLICMFLYVCSFCLTFVIFLYYFFFDAEYDWLTEKVTTL